MVQLVWCSNKSELESGLTKQPGTRLTINKEAEKITCGNMLRQ